MNKIYDSLIIGSGPCGIGAALEMQKLGLDALMITGYNHGGKVNIAPRVDNYPGFTKVPGPQLAKALFQRIIDNNFPYVDAKAESLKEENKVFEVATDNGSYFAKTLVIATGTAERKLGLEKEDKLLGRGISYCAVCDGHFFKGKKVLVIGGGNSALKEAIYLSDLCEHVTLIHRRNEFRGNEKIVSELKEKTNVEILTPFIPLNIIGDEYVQGATIQNKETNEIIKLDVDGIFPLVGQIPNTQFINLDNIKNEHGNIPVNNKMESEYSNVYAGGDVLPRDIRQIYLSEYDGKRIARSISEKLNGNS